MYTTSVGILTAQEKDCFFTELIDHNGKLFGYILEYFGKYVVVLKIFVGRAFHR